MNDEVVAALPEFADSSLFTAREKLALQFAESMALDPQQIDNKFFHELRRRFSAAEIIELGMLTRIFIGYGRLLAALDLENRDS